MKIMLCSQLPCIKVFKSKPFLCKIWARGWETRTEHPSRWEMVRSISYIYSVSRSEAGPTNLLTGQRLRTRAACAQDR